MDIKKLIKKYGTYDCNFKNINQHKVLYTTNINGESIDITLDLSYNTFNVEFTQSETIYNLVNYKDITNVVININDVSYNL